MASGQRIARAVLELTTDLAGYKSGLNEATQVGKKFASEQEGTFKRWAQENEQSLRAVGVALAGAVGLIAGLGAGIVALGKRGSDVADVRDHFRLLAGDVGLTADALLGTLKTAMDGTVSEFDLMRTTNLALSQGLQLTQSQFSLTAETARILADRIGGDATEAYNTLLTVMATGQDRTLKTIGLNIDAEAAVAAHAKAIGVEASALTESQQILAKRNAILAEMRVQLVADGGAELDFADRLSQVKVGLQDFGDLLGEAIARSPVLSAGLDGLGASLGEAFGSNRQQAITTVSGLINNTAIALVELAQTSVEVARGVGTSLDVLRLAIFGTASVAVLLANAFTLALEAAIKFSRFTQPFNAQLRGWDESLSETRTFLLGVQQSLHDQATEALASIRGHSQLDDTLTTLDRTLGDIKARMIAAGSSAADLGVQSVTAAGGVRRIGDSATFSAKALDDVAKRAEAQRKVFEDLADDVTRVSDALGKMADKEAEVEGRQFAEDFRLGNELFQERLDKILELGEATTESQKRSMEIREAMEGRSLESSLARITRDFTERRKKLGDYQSFHGDVLAALATEEALTIAQATREWTFGQSQTRAQLTATAVHAKEQYEAIRDSGEHTAEQIAEAWERWHQADRRARGDMLTGWLSTLGRLSAGFEQLANIAGGALGSVVRDIATVIASLKVAADNTETFNEGLRKLGNSKTRGEGLANIAAGATGIAAAFMQATEKGNAFTKTLKGAVVGAQVGMQIGAAAGPIGAAIGAAIGAVVGAVAGLARALFGGPSQAELEGRKTAAAFRKGLEDRLTRAQKLEVGNETWKLSVIAIRDAYLAVGRTEQEAMDVARRLWEAEKKGPEAVKKVIDEVNVVLEQHNQLMADAKAFVEELPALLNEVAASGGLASQELLDLVKRAGAFGQTSGAVADFIKGQLTGAIGGLKAFVDNAEVESQRAATGLGAAAAAIFGELQRQGMTAREALAALGPLVSKLEERFKTFGFTGGAAFEELKRLSSIATDETTGPLLDAVDGLNMALTGLHNSGILTQEMFDGLGVQVADTFKKLRTQGVSGRDALLLLSPTLQTLFELQTDFGYSVDAATQSLIDQGKEAGLVGEQHRSADEKIAKGIERLVTLMEAFVKSLGIDVPAAADRASDAIRNIPDANIQVNFKPGPFPTPPSEVDWEAWTEGLPPGFHTGGMVTAHRGMFLGDDFKPGETLVKALTGEGILSRMGMRNLGGPEMLSALNRGSGFPEFRLPELRMPELSMPARDASAFRMRSAESSGERASRVVHVATNVTVNGAQKSPSELAREITKHVVREILYYDTDGTRDKMRRGLK